MSDWIDRLDNRHQAPALKPHVYWFEVNEFDQMKECCDRPVEDPIHISMEQHLSDMFDRAQE